MRSVSGDGVPSISCEPPGAQLEARGGSRCAWNARRSSGEALAQARAAATIGSRTQAGGGGARASASPGEQPVDGLGSREQRVLGDLVWRRAEAGAIQQVARVVGTDRRLSGHRQ